jgi:uncharacterized protein (AIM24 family)
MDVNLKSPGLIDVNLKPGEIFLGERGSMSFCEGGIKMSPIETSLVKSIKRKMGGESFFSIVKFENKSNTIQNLKLRYDIQQGAWFHHNSTNTDIVYIDLSKVNGDLIIKSGSFFAASSGIKVDVFFDKSWGRTLFGFGKLFKQRLSGNGAVFIQKNRWQLLNEVTVLSSRSVVIDPKEVYAYPLNSLSLKGGFSFSNFLTGEGFASYTFLGPATIYTYKNRPAEFDLSELSFFDYLKIGFFILIILSFF